MDQCRILPPKELLPQLSSCVLELRAQPLGKSSTFNRSLPNSNDFVNLNFTRKNHFQPIQPEIAIPDDQVQRQEDYTPTPINLSPISKQNYFLNPTKHNFPSVDPEASRSHSSNPTLFSCRAEQLSHPQENTPPYSAESES